MKFGQKFYAPDTGTGSGGGVVGTGGGAVAGSGSPAGATADPWYKGLPDADVGYIQEMKWDKLAHADVTKELFSEYGKLRAINKDPKEYIRKPTPGDAAAQAKYYEELGVPREAKDYDLSKVKFADGTEPDEAFSDMLRSTAHKLHIPSDAVPQLAADLIKFMESADSADAAERTATIEKGRADLKKNWGANFDQNLLVARNAARNLGIKPEAVAALEGVIGYPAVMEMLANVGGKIGEDTLIRGSAGGGNGPMSREQAAAKIGELKGNSGWAARYFKNGQSGPEWKEMHTLQHIATGIVDEYL